jgi:hypothetical protein
MAKYAKVKHFFGNVDRITTKKEVEKSIEKNEIVLIEKNTSQYPSQIFIHFSNIYKSFKFVHLHMVISDEDLRAMPNIYKKSNKKIEIYKYGYLIHEFTDYKEYSPPPRISSKPKPQADMIRGDLLQNPDTLTVSGLLGPNLNSRVVAVIHDPLHDAIKSLEDLTYHQVLYIYYFSSIISMVNSIVNFLTKIFTNIPREFIMLIITVIIIKFL